MKSKLILVGLITASVLLATGCNYEVPLTAKPTQPVDAHLLGDWVAVDAAEPQEEIMHIRQLDDSTYVISMDNDIYRAFHSDFAGVALVSVQDLNSDNRKYLYYKWQLSTDHSQLTLQGVSNKIVPESFRNRAEIQKIIKANLSNPALFGDPLSFERKKPPFSS